MGSELPSMVFSSQFMTGYPTNMSEMGMNLGAGARCHLLKGPNEALSGGLYKKEAKPDLQSHSADDSSTKDNFRLAIIMFAWLAFQLCLVLFGFL
jgi:hypothetical protein